MISFIHYSNIKNNYCLVYLGSCDEYLTQLRILTPRIKQIYDKVNIFLCCSDNKLHILSDYENKFPVSLLKEKKKEMGFVRELKFDGFNHPVEEFLNETGIDFSCNVVQKDPTVKCIICSKGNHPTKNLTEHEILELKKLMIKKGFSTITVDDENYLSAGLVIGVECRILYEAAYSGIQTKLINRGVGKSLFKKMFNHCEILD